MNPLPETSDSQVVDLLRRNQSMTIDQLTGATGVTATAVRQRLTRMMAQGLIERRALRAGRGRPMHTYSLTPRARQNSGNNFADLAMVLWRELRSIRDEGIRRGLLQRVAKSLAAEYRGRIGGGALAERMRSVAGLLAERKVPFQVDEKPGGLPVLSALECPYPALAEADRGVCAMERMLLAELLESDVRLTQCRLDGHTCCQFEAN